MQYNYRGLRELAVIGTVAIGGRALTAKVRGPRFNPAASVFRNSLNYVVKQLYTLCHTCIQVMYIIRVHNLIESIDFRIVHSFSLPCQVSICSIGTCSACMYSPLCVCCVLCPFPSH